MNLTNSWRNSPLKIYWWLGDHLGRRWVELVETSSVTTNASGAKTASALYREASCKDKAFGETRFTSGTLSTDYKFTGQREESALGIYWFSSRWFDPTLGRFTSPDTIVPTSTQGTQAWDRYAFVNNNPVRYKDPSGHRCVEGDYEGSCESVETKMSIDYVLESNRSDFEKKAVMNLLRAGKIGLHIFDYIVLNNIKMDFHWHLYAGAYWKDKENALYLNMDPNTTSADDPFVLNLIAHEVTHLEQGSTWALTKVGELEAWKVGFRVQSYFSRLDEGSPEYDIVNNLEIWDTDTFTELVHEYNLNVDSAGGWSGGIYNFLFDLLPDYPIGIMI